MNVILVRHGETTANADRLFCGHTDVELTEKGIMQANEAYEKLKKYDFDMIFSSDLKRAYETAKIINRDRKLKINVVPELREINFGEFEGHTFDEILSKDASFKSGYFDDNWNYTFPNGESLEKMNHRIITAYKKVLEENEDKNILMVLHAGVIRGILSNEISENYKSYWKYDIENCGISKIKYYNDIAILKEMNK
jgi:alpha-ribazole phosphatase